MSSMLIGFGGVVRRWVFGGMCGSMLICLASTGEELVTPWRSTNKVEASSGDAVTGRNLFERNCTHCHGDDARGDEGPDLYGLRKSDNRIATIIKDGIKGEMPAFRKKLTDANVQSLIAYLRSLKD